MLAGLGLVYPVGPLWAPVVAGVEALALLAALTATVLARDARWAVAAAIYQLPTVGWLGGDASRTRSFTVALWTVLAIVAIALASVVAVHARRRRIDA